MTNQSKPVEQEDDGFTSTKGNGNTWDPKQNEDKIAYAPENRVYDATVQPDHKTKDVLIGYWIDKKDGVGKHGSSVITIEDKEGVKHDVWLDTVLNSEFEKVPSMNILVRLEWLGTGLKKNMKEGQKGATYNKWAVGYKIDDVRPGAQATQKAVTNVAETKSEPTPETSKQTMSTSNTNDNDDLPF